MGNILVGSLPGVWIGAALLSRVPARALRLALGCVLLGSALGVCQQGRGRCPGVARSSRPDRGRRCSPYAICACARAGPEVAPTAWSRDPPSSPTCRPSRPRRSTSCARSPPSSSGRCCCSPAARTRSCCCAWRRRRSARRASPSRSCTSTPGTTSPRSSSSATGASAELGERLIVATRAGLDRRRARGRGDRPARVAQPPADDDAARRDRRARLRRRLRRRAPRRGARARQGAHLLLPRRVRPVGPEGASAPSCGTSTTGASASGEHMRVFPLSNWTELDIWQYIERGEPRDAVDLLRPRARGLPPRRHALRGLRRTSSCIDGEEPFIETRALPHGRRHDLHRRRRARPPSRSRTSSPRSPRRAITERGETRADDKVSEAAMEDRKREGYF